MNTNKIAVIVGLLVLGGVVLWAASFKIKNQPLPRTFEECAAQGNLVMESYPRQCRTPDGVTFIEEVAAQPQPMTVSGEIVCLPHKQKDGPQTLECAFGLKSAEGVHYGLRDPEMKYVTKLPTGKKVTIEGTLYPNTDPANKYDTVGTLEIISIN